MKVFHAAQVKAYNSKKNSQIISLKQKKGYIGKIKYLPSFSKEWKNVIYSYNKNVMKNIPNYNLNIDKVIKNYFSLYFKNYNYDGANKYMFVKKRRNSLTRIFVSNAEIKHTNNKAIITLFVFNRQKRLLINKYLKRNKWISKIIISHYYSLYKKNIYNIYDLLDDKYKKYMFIYDVLKKKRFVEFELTHFNKFLKLKHLYFKKVWSVLLNEYSAIYLRLLRESNLAYSLNQFKFNKLILLPKLSNVLNKILNKKLEYKIINLKSIAYNSDLFTNALALKLKNIRNKYIKGIFSILNKAYLPIVNRITERTPLKQKNNFILNQYKDMKIISYLAAEGSEVQHNENLDYLLNKINNLPSVAEGSEVQYKCHESKDIHSRIFNYIRYKNMSGIRLEVKGRLTKRYRADKSIYFVKWKGGMKNIDSSFKRLSSVLFRGNTNSNISRSLAIAKRRIGAFAVKGWIGGKD